MKEIIYLGEELNIPERELMSFIGKNLQQEDYETATKLIQFLNDIRGKSGHEPYTLGDIFFMNWASFFPAEKTEEVDKRRCVYAVEFRDGVVKIGVSKAPEQRIKSISKQRGIRVARKIFTAPIDNAFIVEHEIHRLFADYRLEGECFKCQFEDVAKILADRYGAMETKERKCKKQKQSY